MIFRIQILCFAASYGVALVLELSRLLFRSGLRGALMLGFAAAGLLAHSLFLWHRYTTTQIPLSSAFDWYLVAAWGLAVVYLYLAFYHPQNPFGLFVLPLVLALIGAAALRADRNPFPVTHASQVWGAIHGAFLLLGTVAVGIGFAAGVMYLAHAHRLKHKLPPIRGFQLPSLEWLERVNSRAIVVSVIMLGIGVLSGTVLNVVNQGRAVDAVPWTDPVVLSSTLTVAWLVVVAVFAAVYKPARQGRKVAYLTVASFVFLVVSLGVALFLNTEHASPTRSSQRAVLRRGRPETAARAAKPAKRTKRKAPLFRLAGGG